MFEACERGAVAVLVEGVGLVRLEDVEGEAAQACEHARIGADTRGILAEGDVAAVVEGGLDAPVSADGLCGAVGSEWGIGDVESGLRGAAQQPGCGISGEDEALDPDDSGDVGMPVGVGQPVGRIEDSDSATFVAISALVAAVGRPERRCGCGDLVATLVQGWLVVLDLDDQGDIGLCGNLEMFF